MPVLSRFSPLHAVTPPSLDFVPPAGDDSRLGDPAAQHYAEVRRDAKLGYVDEGLVLQPAVAPSFLAVEARYAQGFALNYAPELKDIRSEDVAATDPSNLTAILEQLGPTKDLLWIGLALGIAIWGLR